MKLSLILPGDLPDIQSFDCGDADINSYLHDDAWRDRENLFSQTYLWRRDGKHIAAYCTLVNDNLQRRALPDDDQEKYGAKVPYSHYPAVKLARLGVGLTEQGQGLGKSILKTMGFLMSRTDNKTGCRFIILDAYRDRLGFYSSIGFRPLTARPHSKTVPMFLDLKPFRQEH